MRATIIALVLACLTLSNTACIGRMAVSGKVMAFNLSATEDKWGREILFLAMHILPVYGFAAMADLIVVNSIEFWTGENPITHEPRLARSGDENHGVTADGGEVISTLRKDGSIDIEIRTADGEAHFLNVVREDGAVVGRDANGERIARVDSTTGEIQSFEDVEKL
jgi:hypothetical protein